MNHTAAVLPPNDVLRLRQERLALTTRPFNARGATVDRCPRCLIARTHCCCPWARPGQSPLQFVLLMHHKEPMKPTNTGRLIAEILPETRAFCWDRTEPDPALLALLANPRYRSIIVFPASHAEPEQVIQQIPATTDHRQPLMILLDGTWKQARRMFQSDYLASLPVLSIAPEAASQYRLRSAAHPHQLATAEVAAQVLAIAGDQRNAQALDAFFQVFARRYEAGKRQRPVCSHGEPFTFLEQLQP
ncbi:tRNA-uridine aminocarboxypropyltransferase [Ferrimonas gelatinilytica]|uniref:tRNA-uridine aminocarboxypropyltransferase n=1 Tax=Ferrimonas gelatinilytica TaxID=1255257 RepID=A0ABP9SAL1_9GAMM